MYFESIFIEPNKVYTNIYNNKLLKKFTKIAFSEHLNQNDTLRWHTQSEILKNAFFQ